MGHDKTSSYTSYDSLMNTSNDKFHQQQKKQSLSWSNNKRSSITKTSWQRARDMSIDMISRKSARLSIKQDFLRTIASPGFTTRKSLSHRPSIGPKSAHISRISKISTEKESTEIPTSSELTCSFCEETCVSDYLRCRICPKIYHTRCLFQRGHITDPSFGFPRLAKQDWSCPECSDLTRILNQDELNYLINGFEQIVMDKDGYIVLEEFISFQSNKTNSNRLKLFIQDNQQLVKKLFSLIDSKQKGVVAWADFVLFYSCKLIAMKDKTKLTTKLTEKELILAKRIFFNDPKKLFDYQSNRIITREYFNQISKDFLFLLTKKYGIEFLQAILDLNQFYQEKSEKFSVMNWTEFLRQISLLILLNRINDNSICSQSRRASIPAHLSKASVVLRSSLPPMEDDTSSRLSFFQSNSIDKTIPYDESFCKYAKVLAKINQRNYQEDLNRKQMGPFTKFIILENLNPEKNNMNVPKLKANARDDRKTIIDPWTAVKQIQQLRTQPILLNTPRIQMLTT